MFAYWKRLILTLWHGSIRLCTSLHGTRSAKNGTLSAFYGFKLCQISASLRHLPVSWKFCIRKSVENYNRG